MDLLRITVIGGLLGGLALGSLGVGTSIARAQHEEPFHEENAEEAEELLDEAHEAGGHDEHGAAGAHGSEAEHGEAHAAELDMPRLAGQLINFLLWAGILYWLLKDRLPAFLSSRRATIQGELDEAARMKAEAERKFAEYSDRIENLDHELDRMREEMRKGGLAERDRIVAEAASRGEKMRAEARFLVEQQMKQLREDLTREAIEAAVGAAESILKERALDPVRGSAEQQRLATDYLDRLAAQLKDGALSPTATTKNEKPSA